MQRSLNQKLNNVQPTITCVQRIISENGRQALAVIVPYSTKRPHFSGPAYIRRGSESLVALPEDLAVLTQSQNTKVARILAHKGEQVYVVNSQRTPHGASESYWTGAPYIEDCNQDFVTIGNGPNPSDCQTFPLTQIDIGIHYQSNRFQITIHR